ncbi:MAG: hypothetical protein LBI02_09680 [Opitutaceae bacterium]|jgi:hypothetical protein|nr:hypothetical protein [Opitutaceae bacterium]
MFTGKEYDSFSFIRREGMGKRGRKKKDKLVGCAAVVAQVVRLFASFGTQPAECAMVAQEEADLGMQQTWRSALRSGRRVTSEIKRKRMRKRKEERKENENENEERE